MKKNIKITKDTTCCISIAIAPGNFGSLIFNKVFKSLSMDYIYKPFQVMPKDLSKAVDAVRVLHIKGCGVSMPHKTVIGKYLDKVDVVAKEIGAINTVVNNDGILTGYNTDVIGVQKALISVYKAKGKTAHIVGAGGAARAAIVALKKEGCKEIILSSRDDKKSKKVSSEFNITYCPNNKTKEIKANIFINATPVGMSPNINEMVINKDDIKKYDVIMDVVVSPLNTKLIQTAKKEKKIIVPGYVMSFHQAAAQFTLYTGKEAPLSMMMKYVKEIIKQK